MPKKIDPGYNALVNETPESFTLITHVPGFPPASGVYENNVIYNKQTGCFYRCVYVNQNWKWERVTHGTNPHYVLPVNFIVPDTTLSETQTFNLCVETICAIIGNLRTMYGEEIPLPDPSDGNGLSYIEAMESFNTIVDHINRVCGTSLVKAVSSDNGNTCSEFITKINALVKVINPHAGESLIHSKLNQLIDAIADITSTSDASSALATLVAKAKTIRES